MKNTNIDTQKTPTAESLALEAEVAEFINGPNGDKHEWLLLTRQHDLPCEAAPHEAREDLMQDLANALTCHCAPVAILRQGKLLTVSEVEALENEALELLGPISGAKAEGKL